MVDVWDPRERRILPIRGDLNIERHLDVEKVLVLSQVARHLLLRLVDILLQLTYPRL